MRNILFLVLAFGASCGCAAYDEQCYEHLQPATPAASTAGAAAPAPTTNKIWTGVGVSVEELQVCYAAKSKIIARYTQCGEGFEELPTELRSRGVCANNKDYLIFNAPMPRKGYAKFEVDRREHVDGGSGGWRLYQYVECDCASSEPCTVVPSTAAVPAEPEGRGAGVGVSSAACTSDSFSQLQHGAWNWFKSRSGNPACDGGDNSTRRVCHAGDGLLTWVVKRTLADMTTPTLQVWFAVDSNLEPDYGFTCVTAQNCGAMACKQL
jgi:hypothetical protein